MLLCTPWRHMGSRGIAPVILKLGNVWGLVELARNLMAHAQKRHFVFRLNGRVHLNRRGSQYSRLLAAEVCASALVMLDTPRSEVMWEYWLPTPFARFPFISLPVRHRVPPHSERSLVTLGGGVKCLRYPLRRTSGRQTSGLDVLETRRVCCPCRPAFISGLPSCAALYRLCWPGQNQHCRGCRYGATNLSDILQPYMPSTQWRSLVFYLVHRRIFLMKHDVSEADCVSVFRQGKHLFWWTP